MTDIKTNQSVERTFRVLECFSVEKNKLELGEIAQMTQISKSTVYRLLQTMVKSGYIKQDPYSQKYSLGFKMFHLGAVASSDFNLKEAAIPFMKELSKEIKETINLNILIDSYRVCIEIVESPEAIRTVVKVGERNHICLGPSGRVMLAHLPEAEKRQIIDQAIGLGILPMGEEHLVQELDKMLKHGYGMEINVRVKGAFAIAAPLFDSTGRPIGSITASGPMQRLSNDRFPSMVERVIRTSYRISEAMGWQSSFILN